MTSTNTERPARPAGSRRCGRASSATSTSTATSSAYDRRGEFWLPLLDELQPRERARGRLQRRRQPAVDHAAGRPDAGDGRRRERQGAPPARPARPRRARRALAGARPAGRRSLDRLRLHHGRAHPPAGGDARQGDERDGARVEPLRVLRRVLRHRDGRGAVPRSRRCAVPPRLRRPVPRPLPPRVDAGPPGLPRAPRTAGTASPGGCSNARNYWITGRSHVDPNQGRGHRTGARDDPGHVECDVVVAGHLDRSDGARFEVVGEACTSPSWTNTPCERARRVDAPPRRAGRGRRGAGRRPRPRVRRGRGLRPAPAHGADRRLGLPHRRRHDDRSSARSRSSSPTRAGSTSTPRSIAGSPSSRTRAASPCAICSRTAAVSHRSDTTRTARAPTPRSMPAFVAAHPHHAFTPEEIVTYVQRRPLLSKPGTTVHYSNVNTIVLGIVVAAVTHSDLAAALHKQLLGPARSVRHLLAATEHRSPAPVPGVSSDPAAVTSLGAAGAIVSTPRDLLAFSDGFLRPRAAARRTSHEVGLPHREGWYRARRRGLLGRRILRGRRTRAARHGVSFFALGATSSGCGGSAIVDLRPGRRHQCRGGRGLQRRRSRRPRRTRRPVHESRRRRLRQDRRVHRTPGPHDDRALTLVIELRRDSRGCSRKTSPVTDTRFGGRALKACRCSVTRGDSHG